MMASYDCIIEMDSSVDIDLLDPSIVADINYIQEWRPPVFTMMPGSVFYAGRKILHVVVHNIDPPPYSPDQALLGAIAAHSLNWTVHHMQSVDSTEPVYDGQWQVIGYQPAVLIQGVAANLVPFMPDEPVYDGNGNITGWTPATTLHLHTVGREWSIV